jgi:hypothetical protein
VRFESGLVFSVGIGYRTLENTTAVNIDVQPIRCLATSVDVLSDVDPTLSRGWSISGVDHGCLHALDFACACK